MTKVLLENTLAAELQACTKPLELCDPKGNVVGIFLPTPANPRYRSITVPFTSAELEQAENEPGGRSLAAILADLEKA